MEQNHYGFLNRLLRVDLSQGAITTEPLKAVDLRAYVGGTGLAAKYLYDEVPPGVAWDDPANRLIFMSGPLSGTRLSGGGNFSAVSKGPMTNLAGASQASGFFAAYLKKSGFDGIILQGIAPKLSYLVIDDGKAELRDAAHVRGLDTYETEEAIKKEVGGKAWSVFCIGPAGENLVRFAAICGDQGHVASKNGLGAVMGKKNLKAVAVKLGKHEVPVADPDKLKELAAAMHKEAKEADGGNRYLYGTAGHVGNLYKTGSLPIKNYTTNAWPEYELFTGQAIRERFPHQPKPCWACNLHTRWMTVTEGPYKGFASRIMRALRAARSSAAPLAYGLPGQPVTHGFRHQRTGWLRPSMNAMTSLLKRRNGLELNWGNVPAAAELLKLVASRKASIIPKGEAASSPGASSPSAASTCSKAPPPAATTTAAAGTN